MARVAFVNPTPDLKDRYSKQATPLTKTVNSSVRWTGKLTPPRKKVATSTKSLLPQISALWGGLTNEQQELWKSAARAQSYNAWNAFVQDTAYRIKYGIEGVANPSDLHMYKCGEIVIGGAATHFRIEQQHPIEYYKMRKVKGTKSQFTPVPIIEQLVLPLTVGLSFRTNLTAAGPAPTVKYYAQVATSYQGRTVENQVGFDIPLSTDWSRQTATLRDVVGHARWYTLVIELSDVQGTLQFDLLQSQHTGTNFARDFRCSSVGVGFSNANYQLPPSWAASELVVGASFGSVYPEDLWV